MSLMGSCLAEAFLHRYLRKLIKLWGAASGRIHTLEQENAHGSALVPGDFLTL